MRKVPLAKREERWLVQGDDVSSGRLMRRIEAEPGIVQVRQVARDVVVLTMPVNLVEKLRKEFGSGLLIEPDEDLGH